MKTYKILLGSFQVGFCSMLKYRILYHVSFAHDIKGVSTLSITPLINPRAMESIIDLWRHKYIRYKATFCDFMRLVRRIVCNWGNKSQFDNS